MATVHGCAHVGGNYHISTPSTEGFVTDGLELIKDTGFGAVKIFFSRDYATSDYDLESWSSSPTDLTELAQTTEMSTVLGDSTIKHFLINTFGFDSAGEDDLWKFGLRDQPTLLTDEYAEVKALAEHLLTTYNDTGKTFVLQNWESDWAFLGVSDPDDYSNLTGRWIDNHVAYHRTRYQAVEDARRGTSSTNVQVLYAYEVNRVVDCLNDKGMMRTVNKVLPRLRGCLDMVSYSCYDAVYDLPASGTINAWHADQDTMVAFIQEKLPAAIARISEASGGVPVFIGEWGVAETEVPAGYDTDTLVQTVYDVAIAQGCPYHIYWQVFNNENAGDGRGYYIYKSNGALSEAGTKFEELLL